MTLLCFRCSHLLYQTIACCLFKLKLSFTEEKSCKLESNNIKESLFTDLSLFIPSIRCVTTIIIFVCPQKFIQMITFIFFRGFLYFRNPVIFSLSNKVIPNVCFRNILSTMLSLIMVLRFTQPMLSCFMNTWISGDE